MIDREKMLLELITNLEEDKRDLQQENKQLKERIDRTKEYIEENVVCMNEGNLLIQLNVDKLLEILKGENNG